MQYVVKKYTCANFPLIYFLELQRFEIMALPIHAKKFFKVKESLVALVKH